MIVGFVAGGLGAGPLQVLWGDRFARHATLFAAVASPAAAIVTALVAGMSNDHTSFIGFAVIPLLSFGLLLFEANRTGLSWSDLTQKPKRGTRGRERECRRPLGPLDVSKGRRGRTGCEVRRGQAHVLYHDVFVPVPLVRCHTRPTTTRSRSSAEAQYSDSS